MLIRLLLLLAAAQGGGEFHGPCPALERREMFDEVQHEASDQENS